MTELRCSQNDNRQEPLTLSSKQWEDAWRFFLSFFLQRNMLTPEVQGDVLFHVEWWYLVERFYPLRLLQSPDKSPSYPRPWPWWNPGLKHCYFSPHQGDEWMEGVIGLGKRGTPAPAATLFLPPTPPHLSALGKIKRKWMATSQMKQLNIKTNDTKSKQSNDK